MLADGPLLGDEQDCFNGKTPQPLGVGDSGDWGGGKRIKRAEQSVKTTITNA